MRPSKWCCEYAFLEFFGPVSDNVSETCLSLSASCNKTTQTLCSTFEDRAHRDDVFTLSIKTQPGQDETWMRTE